MKDRFNEVFNRIITESNNSVINENIFSRAGNWVKDKWQGRSNYLGGNETNAKNSANERIKNEFDKLFTAVPGAWEKTGKPNADILSYKLRAPGAPKTIFMAYKLSVNTLFILDDKGNFIDQVKITNTYSADDILNEISKCFNRKNELKDISSGNYFVSVSKKEAEEKKVAKEQEKQKKKTDKELERQKEEDRVRSGVKEALNLLP